MRLILVRHGRLTWNAEGRIQGIADPPLSPDGARQAQRLRPLVDALGVDTVVTSDLERARDTAEVLVGAGVARDARWREVDLGAWTGLLVAELNPADAAVFARWRRGGAVPPGGETWEAARARVHAAARGLLDAGARHALVVTHGATIRAACAALGGATLTNLAGVPNASLTIIETEPRPHLLAYGVAPRPGAMPRGAPGTVPPPPSG